MMYFLTLTALISLASAAVTPTSPDGATVTNEGSTLTALWTADTTGTWQNTQIQLMTGDNYNMVALETLATGIDGTTVTSWSGPCPQVSPNSQIYFLQFTEGGNVTTATWTTRFTIADATGASTAPTNSTVYNGQAVSWGTGVLLDGTNTTTSSNSSSMSSSASTAAASSSSALTVYGAVSSAASGAASSSTTSVSSAVGSSSSSTSASAAATTSAKSGAGRLEVGFGMALLGMLGAMLL